jgi:DNA-binding MarR family transcriptional regulator
MAPWLYQLGPERKTLVDRKPNGPETEKAIDGEENYGYKQYELVKYKTVKCKLVAYESIGRSRVAAAWSPGGAMAKKRSVMERALKECPFYVVTRASLVMTSAFKKSFAAAGLGKIRPSYLVVLWSLWEREGVRMSDLARAAGLEPSTMTGLLDRMERDGYVVRKADPDDRRALNIHLTEAGREARDTVQRLVQETIALLFDGIDDPEIDATNDVLYRVMDNAREGGER